MTVDAEAPSFRRTRSGRPQPGHAPVVLDPLGEYRRGVIAVTRRVVEADPEAPAAVLYSRAALASVGLVLPLGAGVDSRLLAESVRVQVIQETLALYGVEPAWHWQPDAVRPSIRAVLS